MGYFDGLLGASFRKTADGKTIFYPFGMSGSSYALSEDGDRKIRAFLKRYMLLSLIVLILAMLIFRSYGLFLLVVLLPVYMHKISGLLSTEERISKRPTIRDSASNMACTMGLSTCVLLLIVNCILFLASIVCLCYLQAIWVGILGVILFGLGVVHSSLLVKHSLGHGSHRVSKGQPQS